MSVKLISPKKSVNSAFLKLPVPCEKMEQFQATLTNLYSKRKLVQDEECHKGEIWNFLRKIFEPNYSVQVNCPINLTIFNGNTANAKPAVIIEAKSSTSKPKSIPSSINSTASPMWKKSKSWRRDKEI